MRQSRKRILAITINSNIASLRAQRQLATAGDRLSTVFERLSSGSRINKASDDAAGLAITSTLNVTARVLAQGQRNINDGVSYLNVAEGALSQLSAITTRQKELSEEAANGSYSSVQRAALNKEADSLTQEYNRIIQSTKFNGRPVFDAGKNANLRVQTGFGVTGGLSLNVGTSLGTANPIGSGTFAASRTFSSASFSTGAVATGDFNHDGNLDIVTGDAGAEGLDVQFGNGQGGFSAAATYGNGGPGGALGPAGISTADVNHDGVLDIVTENSYDGSTIGVLLGNADGSFQAAVSFDTGYSSCLTSMHIVNLNGYPQPDIVLTGLLDSNVTILSGSGDGNYSTASTISCGFYPSDLAAGDFNGDGRIDLAVTSDNLDTLSILLNNGNSTYRTFSYATTSGIGAVAANDLNGDGKSDLVLTNVSDASLEVWSNFNGAVFSTHSTASSSLANAKGVNLTDLNGDGKADMVAVSATSDKVSFLLGNGDGSFKAGTCYATGTTNGYSASSGLVSGDFNNYSAPDIIIGGTSFSAILNGKATNLGLAAPLDLTTQTGARQALGTLETRSSRISSELGGIGGFQSRLQVALSSGRTSEETYRSASAQITDIDVAEEASTLSALAVLQNAASGVLAQVNQQPALALTLLR